MNSTLEYSLKRSADELYCHSGKRMRLINHAYDHVPCRGIKRRNEEEMEEPAKRSKMTPCAIGAKRKGDSIVMNPTKRIKTVHRSWRRSVQGCRPCYIAEHDHDKDGGNTSVLIAIVA